MISGKMEVKKVGMRQSKDGVILLFVVHPDDVTAELVTAPIGTQLMIAYHEYEGSGDPVAEVTAAAGVGTAMEQPPHYAMLADRPPAARV